MPQVTARELVRFLRAQGFAEDRQSGSHLTLLARGTQGIGNDPGAHGLRHRARLGGSHPEGRRIHRRGLSSPAMIRPRFREAGRAFARRSFCNDRPYGLFRTR
jgi:hypothetical protein